MGITRPRPDGGVINNLELALRIFYMNQMRFTSWWNWLHSTEERPATLAETLDCINPTLYRCVNVTPFSPVILLAMPVSTGATPEGSFSTMRRVKTYLRATMRTERLSALALMHVYKDND